MMKKYIKPDLDVEVIEVYKGLNGSDVSGYTIKVLPKGAKPIDFAYVWRTLSMSKIHFDVDAYTGGFNLQIAFSTGYLAGVNI